MEHILFSYKSLRSFGGLLQEKLNSEIQPCRMHFVIELFFLPRPCIAIRNSGYNFIVPYNIIDFGLREVLFKINYIFIFLSIFLDLSVIKRYYLKLAWHLLVGGTWKIDRLIELSLEGWRASLPKPKGWRLITTQSILSSSLFSG